MIKPFTKFLIFLSWIILLTRPSNAEEENASYIFYKTQQGDQIGKILDHLGVTGLWGRNRAVERSIELNPFELGKDGLILKPGALLKLPAPTGPSCPYSLETRNQISPSSNQSEPELLPALKEEKKKPALSFKGLSGGVAIEGSGAYLGHLKLLSRSAVGFDFNLNHPLNHKFEAILNIKYLATKFSNIIATTNESIDHASNKTLHLRTGLLFSNLRHVFQVGLYGDLGQELFLRRLSSSQFSIDQAWIPKLQTTGIFSFYRGKRLRLTTQGTLGFLFPHQAAGAKVHRGYSWSPALLSVYAINKKLSLLAETSFEYQKQDSDLTRHIKKTLLLYLGLTYNF